MDKERQKELKEAYKSVHGQSEGQAEKDLEGLQTMRELANNMSFLIKAITLCKEKYGLPSLNEDRAMTNFIK